MEILKKSHTVVLDPREGEYCWRKRATLQARVERVFLLQMFEQGYQTELLKKIDESLLASVDKGIHNKTTKYGLPTYWNYRPNET